MSDEIIDTIRRMPQVITSKITMPKINEPVVLHEGAVTFLLDGCNTLAGTGTITAHWVPTPTLYLSLRCIDSLSGILQQTAGRKVDMTVSFEAFPRPTLSFKVDAFDLATLDQGSFSRRLQSGFSYGADLNVTKVQFHIANCVFFHGCFLQYPTDTRIYAKPARSVFQSGKWRFQIDWSPQAINLGDALDNGSGYLLTHVGELTRVDGQAFPLADASEILEDLGYLLSFCSGRWCGPCLSYGINDEDETLSADWRIGAIDPWKEHCGWFPVQENCALDNLAPDFLAKIAEDQWRMPLRLAIAWYIDALRSRTWETSIVNAQTALELLAWTMLVHVEQRYSMPDFDKINAADKIRELITLARVTLSLPPKFKELSRYCGDVKDGPGVIAAVRNKIVHADSVAKILAPGAPVRHQARELSLFYLELVLLFLIGYSGVYLSRAAESGCANDYENVPWT